MNPKKILLVYPPNQLMPIETPRPDGSLGLLYLASIFEQAGFETDVLDASVGLIEGDRLEDTFYQSVMQPSGLTRIGMTSERIGEVIVNGRYAIIGINSNHTIQTKTALEVARIAKRVNPEALVMMGGVNARNMTKYLLDSGAVDVICLTEGEKIALRIVEQWTRNRTFDGVSGVVYRRNGTDITQRVAPGDVHVNLDALPFPAWHKLPFQHYDAVCSPHGAKPQKNIRYAPIMTSRGCPFRCKYCHISMEKADNVSSGGIGELRLKSVARVIAEIELLKKLGVHRLYFEDDSLLAKKERVRSIFKAVREFGLQIAAVNGVNLLHLQKREQGRLVADREYLELMKEAGFDMIVFPVESAVQRILDTYAPGKLNHSRMDVIELVKTAVSVGITCPINMMIGFPDETEAEMRESIELGKRLVDAGAEYCTFFIPIPFLGSRLYEVALHCGYLQPNFDPDVMNYKHPVLQNTTVPPERIVELRDAAWREVNSRAHVAKRLEERTGGRWRDGAPAAAS